MASWPGVSPSRCWAAGTRAAHVAKAAPHTPNAMHTAAARRRGSPGTRAARAQVARRICISAALWTGCLEPAFRGVLDERDHVVPAEEPGLDPRHEHLRARGQPHAVTGLHVGHGALVHKSVIPPLSTARVPASGVGLGRGGPAAAPVLAAGPGQEIVVDQVAAQRGVVGVQGRRGTG